MGFKRKNFYPVTNRTENTVVYCYVTRATQKTPLLCSLIVASVNSEGIASNYIVYRIITSNG
jgi:hypothetical protein